MRDPLLGSKEHADRQRAIAPYLWGAVALAILLVIVIAAFGYFTSAR